MARLFALVVVAAAIVPTAVLGGGATLLPPYTVAQVKHAFAAEGIPLTLAHDSQVATVDLIGVLAPSTKLGVSVITGKSSGAFLIAVTSDSNQSAMTYAYGFRGNVVVNWTTHRSCRQQAARVRSALSRLNPPEAQIGVSCQSLGSLAYP